MMGTSAIMALDETEMFKALYAAEGGIRKIIVELNNSPDMNDFLGGVLDNLQGYPVGDAVINSISCEDMGDELAVTVMGGCGTAQKTLVAHIRKPRPLDGVNAELIQWREKDPVY